MTEGRTVLVFPAAMQEFAEAHGAAFDKKTGHWGIDGDVPNELVRFIVHAERRRNFVAESNVQCVCGCSMAVRNNRSTGEAFWGCSSPRCHKTRPIDHVPAVTGLSESDLPPRAGIVVEFEDRGRADAIFRRAVQDFGNTGVATKWLQDKKVGLRGHGETPLEAIKTSAGCARVELLLDQLFGD